MAFANWRFKDGLKIPKRGTHERKMWDKVYVTLIRKAFGKGKLIACPISSAISGHFVGQVSSIAGRNRTPGYLRMLKGGDILPPIVVRRNGLGWHVIDGNARLTAALMYGLTELSAVEI